MPDSLSCELEPIDGQHYRIKKLKARIKWQTSTMLNPAFLTHSETIGLTQPGAFQVRNWSSWTLYLIHIWMYSTNLPLEEEDYTPGLEGEILYKEEH